MLKKLLIILMIVLSSMHLFDIQANTNVLSQLPEAIQKRLYERLNNQEDDTIIETRINALDGFSYDNFGYSVALDGTTVVVGTPQNDGGAVYVYDLTRINQSGFERKITASDIFSGDQFGYSVALDGATLVVGSNRDDSVPNSTNEYYGEFGSVYVYDLDLDNGHPDFERKITASDASANRYFGRSVAIDGSTLVVGTALNDKVYVYDLTLDGHAETTGNPATPYADGFEIKIYQDRGAGYDNFGQSIALDGNTLVVSAEKVDDKGFDSGAVYVYDLSKNSGNEFEYKITASDGASNDYFGHQIALDASTLVVSAFRRDNSTGSVYVYDLDLYIGDPDFERKITASDGLEKDNFGSSVAIDGNTILVGSYRDIDAKGSKSGSVYVYDLTLDGNAETAENAETPYADGFETKITASDAASGDNFGWSVAIEGDTLVVGAFGDSHKGSSSGSVYIYNGTFGSGTTKTDEEWASEITAMIDALSEPYVRADVEAARTAYDALTPEQQALISAETYQTLLDAEQALIDIDAAAAVYVMIEALSEPYVRADVEAARDAYDALTPEQKTIISNLTGTYQKLLDAEQALEDIDAASIVDGMIAALSEPYDAVAIYDARLAYDALTETQKGYVTRLPELEAAEQAVADQTAVAAVDALIDALTSPYVRADVEAARAAYDALTENQKQLVTGLPDLEAAEAGLVDQALAQAVELLINTLTTPYDPDAVQTARDAYDALTEAQQDLITAETYQILLDAEQALADIDAASAVDALIDALSAPYVRADVEAARTAYDNLTEAQQALVTGLAELEAAEQALADLDAAAAVDALIDALTEPYDLETVQAVRDAHDALTETQQALVTGLLDLETAEAAVEEQVNKEEAARIDALILTLTEDSTEEEIEAAREAYENLTEEQQALVTELPTLVTYEEQVEPQDATGIIFFMLFFIGVISAVIYFGFYKRDKEENETI